MCHVRSGGRGGPHCQDDVGIKTERGEPCGCLGGENFQEEEKEVQRPRGNHLQNFGFCSELGGVAITFEQRKGLI